MRHRLPGQAKVSRLPGERAVVIGAGHNGLICAAYLAKAGIETTVVEARDSVGGCASTVDAIGAKVIAIKLAIVFAGPITTPQAFGIGWTLPKWVSSFIPIIITKHLPVSQCNSPRPSCNT